MKLKRQKPKLRTFRHNKSLHSGGEQAQIVFCTAPAEIVEKALKTASSSESNIVFVGSSSHPFAARESVRYLSWGDGFFSLKKGAAMWRELSGLKPTGVILPLNNSGAAGYDTLRFFSRLLSKNVQEVRPDGTARHLEERLFSILFKPGLKFNALLISTLELLAPLFRNRLVKSSRITEPITKKTPLQYETIAERVGNERPEVSVVIRTFNEEKFLPQTLEMVFSQEGVNKEVIIIDSGSTDTTLQIARNFQARIYRIGRKSFSYGTALNLGTRLSRGRIVVNLSAHAIPRNRHWLKKLIKPLENNKVGGVHGRELPIEGNAGLFERKILSDAYGEMEIVRTSDPFFSNANSAAPKKILMEFPFDETLGWAEDQLWALKIQKAGYKTVYTPRAEVFHSHNLSMRQNFDRAFAYYRMLFSTIYKGRKEEIRNSYRKRLSLRALSFRRFLCENGLLNPIFAFFYAPYCEYINYLGCEMACGIQRKKDDFSETSSSIKAS